MRVTIFVALVLMLLTPAVAPAQSGGHPVKLLSPGDFNFSLVTAYTLNTDMADYDLTRTGNDGSAVTERNTARFKNEFSYLAEAAFGLTNWLTVYGRAGCVTGGKMIDKNIASDTEWQANLGTALAWQVGGRFLIYSFEKGPSLVIDASYLRYDNRSVSNWQNNTQGYSASDFWSTDDNLDYQQVEALLAVNWTFGRFNFFGGVGYTYGWTNFSGSWTDNDYPVKYPNYDYDSTMTLQNNITPLIGLEAKVIDSLTVGFAARTVSQTMFSLWLGYTF